MKLLLMHSYARAELLLYGSVLCQHARLIKMRGGLAVITEARLNYYAALHVRLSTAFSKNNLIAVVGADVLNDFLITYIFLGADMRRLFLFFIGSSIQSIHDLYYNAAWYERELMEFFGIYVSGARDCRKLLLTYNNTTNPLKKHVLRQKTCVREFDIAPRNSWVL